MSKALKMEVSGYDPANNLVLIKSKMPAFSVVSNLSSLKKGLGSVTNSVWKSDVDEISISVTPADVRESFGGNSAVSISMETMATIRESLLKFYKKIVKKKFKTTEFIPLSGYSWKDLKKDVKAAIESKRNFCVLETYQSYLDLCGPEEVSGKRVEKKEPDKDGNQYLVKHLDVPYMSDDYCNIAILIETDGEKDLKEIYTPKLIKSDWI